ncbi:MAG: DEAD/DEAH box helicase [Chloroflexi bacterium]|nr:DEAD/DEAH box helicase [Chloroflexota bacterium]
MTLPTLLSLWQTDPATAPNFAAWRTLLARPAHLVPLPPLPDPLADALASRGIHALYSHQSAAYEAARRGENVVLATSTASGKTLAYNLPVLASLIENPQARALYFFPTKALTQDQSSNLQTFQPSNFQAAIYDGDTPQSHRAQIRKTANILLTNPDMLHTGILPHHTNWDEFFRNLKFIVIDELHTYRGVFGSHVANVIRRLKRAAAFHGSHPQFILTSATIGNPKELAENLIEEPVTLIDKDGSSRGERHFLIYNPPIVDESIGLRKSAFDESLRLAGDLLANNIQSVMFARTRRSVEILLKQLGDTRYSKLDIRKSNIESSNIVSPIRGYRSGYLPSQRREIERGLRDGSVRLVVATNALELGIDIGGLGAAILVGYAGSISSTWQQAGRAGRGDDPAVAVLVASPNPLDQFLAHHPEYFFGRSPEQALVNPDHLLILLEHLRCALFELPFKEGEGFGRLPADLVREYLDVLVANNEAHASAEKVFWMADAYPAANISLRSASPANVVLHTEDEDGPRTIGQVDLASAVWMVHPRAIYLHEGQQYFVQDLDLTRNTATLIPVGLDYFTEPLRETTIQILSTSEMLPSPVIGRGTGGEGRNVKSWGELQVTTQVTGFRKRTWLGGENLGEEPLDLPPSDLQTTGYWLSLSEETVTRLRETGNWSSDPNDYGPDWPKIRERARTRDGFRCQMCGLPESAPSTELREAPLWGRTSRQHDVHHKIPFRNFKTQNGIDLLHAHRLDNLITLCPSCHHKAEQNVRMRSGLAGLGYVLSQLAPLFLMCDPGDLGLHVDAAGSVFGAPSVALYDQVPAGIGFSQKLFELHDELLTRALQLVSECPCEDGCPSCVGPAGENGIGGKEETMEILKEISRH